MNIYCSWCSLHEDVWELGATCWSSEDSICCLSNDNEVISKCCWFGLPPGGEEQMVQKSMVVARSKWSGRGVLTSGGEEQMVL